MREHSAHGEVLALDRARELILARSGDRDEYDDAQTRILGELDAMADGEKGAAVVDLINALARFSSLMAFTFSTIPREEKIEMTYKTLCESSIEHDEDGS